MTARTHVVGNLTRDPELRFIANGTAVATFSIAWNDRKRNADGTWQDGDTHYLDVTCWRGLAESVAELTKGTRVVTVGELKSRRYEKDGVQVTAWQLTAEDVGVAVDRFAKSGQGAGWSKESTQTSGEFASQYAEPPF